MADDLDSFFNEVSAAEAQVVAEDDDDDGGGDDQVADEEQQAVVPPHAKKRKTQASSKPIRPVGVVVAAASSAKVAQIELPMVPPSIASSSSFATIAKSTSVVPGPPAPPPLPPGPPPPPAAAASSTSNKKPHIRTAAGKKWVDPTLDEWPDNDYRIFVGNLGKEVTDQQLHNHFSGYESLAKAKVVRDKNGISKGFGFVSLLKPLECARAIREMDQSWLGARPIRTKRSDWKDRELNVVRKKQRNKKGSFKF